MTQYLKGGDKVTFDTSKVDLFIAETSNKGPEISQYQKLVLKGINQVGTVIENGATMTTVLFTDKWELPIPTKYLVLLPEAD